MVKADGFEEEVLFDRLLAVLGCNMDSHHADDCAMVSAASTGGTKEQVSAWCDGVYPKERAKLQAENEALHDVLLDVEGYARTVLARLHTHYSGKPDLCEDCAVQSPETRR